MGSLTRMGEKCSKCYKRDKCNHKYMKACPYMEEERNGAADAGIPAGVTAAQPVLRETIQINCGGVMTIVYKDDLEKEIYKALKEPFSIGLNYGA